MKKLPTSPLPIPENIDSNTYEEWVNIDLTTEEKFLLYFNHVHQLNDEIEDGDDPLPKPPSHQETLRAIEVLSNGVQYYCETFDPHNDYVKFVHRTLEKKKYQKNRQFFP